MQDRFKGRLTELGWPDTYTSVPALSSVADSTEDVIKRVVAKELAHFGGTGGTGGAGGTGGLAEAQVRALASDVVAEKLKAFTPTSYRVKEARVVSSGSVALAAGENSAAFRVVGPVSYDASITWVGAVKPEASFRGAVSLLRVEGGGVLGVAATVAGATTPTPVTPTPTPATPTPTPTPTPATPTTGEVATWNLAYGHNGWVVSGKVLARYFQEPVDGWVQAWQYPHEQGTWTPIASDAPTYREQQPNHKALATASRPLGEGDAWVFATKASLADKDSVFVANGDGGAKIVVANGAYAYASRIPQDGPFGTAGVEFANGSWNAVAIKAGDKLEIRRREGYAVGSVIRATGQREQIFAFKFDWRNDTTAGAHGWNFNQVKAEVVRA